MIGFSSQGTGNIQSQGINNQLYLQTAYCRLSTVWALFLLILRASHKLNVMIPSLLKKRLRPSKHRQLPAIHQSRIPVQAHLTSNPSSFHNNVPPLPLWLHGKTEPSMSFSDLLINTYELLLLVIMPSIMYLNCWLLLICILSHCSPSHGSSSKRFPSGNLNPLSHSVPITSFSTKKTDVYDFIIITIIVILSLKTILR